MAIEDKLKAFRSIEDNLNYDFRELTTQAVHGLFDSMVTEYKTWTGQLPPIKDLITEGYRNNLCDPEELPDYRTLVSKLGFEINNKLIEGRIELSNTEELNQIKEIFKNDLYPEVFNPWL